MYPDGLEVSNRRRQARSNPNYVYSSIRAVTPRPLSDLMRAEFSGCHGRGRGVESHRPHHSFQRVARILLKPSPFFLSAGRLAVVVGRTQPGELLCGGNTPFRVLGPISLFLANRANSDRSLDTSPFTDTYPELSAQTAHRHTLRYPS
jgi:hypothetical protein